MKAIVRLIPFVALLTVGCATTDAPHVPHAHQAKQESAAQAQPEKKSVATAQKSSKKLSTEKNLPDVELTAELLNDLILADVAARRGHLDISVGLYLQLAKETRDPRLAEHATRVANYADMSSEALEAANLWVELEPDSIEARQLLTALLVKGGESGSAIDHLERILANEGKSNGFMVVAGLLSRERDKELALNLMKQLVEKRADNPEAQYALSQLALRLGEHNEALAAVQRALELKPGWESASLHQARILIAQSKQTQALEYLDKLISDHPKNTDFRLFYARLLVEQERLADAYEQFKEVAEQQPQHEDALFSLGFIGLQLNKLEDAEKYLLRLKKTGDRGYEVHYYLGRLEEMRDNSDEAKRWYSSITQGEYYMNAQIRIIAIMAMNGELDGALQRVSKLKSQRPAHKLRLDLVEGEILVEGGKYEEAMAVYDSALEEVPENTDLLYARSMVADKLGDYEASERDLRQILARDPNNAEALNALGYTLADKTTRYDEAYELISRALELRPNDYFILDSMGWIKYKLGEHEEAIKYLRRALDMKMDAEIAAHLGEVLWVTGDKEGAKSVWQRALVDVSITSKKEIITEVMERLSK